MGKEDGENPLAKISATRRQTLKASGLVLAETAFAAVAAQAWGIRRAFAGGGYSLENEGGVLVDKQLAEEDHPLLAALHFYFDVEHDEGSIGVLISSRGDGILRIVSRELNPDPGYLVNLPYELKQGGYIRRPVTKLRIGDDEKVWFGIKFVNEQCVQTYTAMRSYRIIRDEDGTLRGEFIGLETLDSKTITPRDADVAKYFIPGCTPAPRP